jgi:hypothetical protein
VRAQAGGGFRAAGELGGEGGSSRGEEREGFGEGADGWGPQGEGGGGVTAARAPCTRGAGGVRLGRRGSLCKGYVVKPCRLTLVVFEGLIDPRHKGITTCG